MFGSLPDWCLFGAWYWPSVPLITVPVVAASAAPLSLARRLSLTSPARRGGHSLAGWSCDLGFLSALFSSTHPPSHLISLSLSLPFSLFITSLLPSLTFIPLSSPSRHPLFPSCLSSLPFLFEPSFLVFIIIFRHLPLKVTWFFFLSAIISYISSSRSSPPFFSVLWPSVHHLGSARVISVHHLFCKPVRLRDYTSTSEAMALVKIIGSIPSRLFSQHHGWLFITLG